jgi:hypothetical protein
VELGQAVTVLLADGQLGALAWAFGQSLPGARLGAIAFDGDGDGDSGLAGRLELIASLRGQGLLADVLSVGSKRAQGRSAVIASALSHALDELSWTAAICVCGQGPIEDGCAALLCGQIASEMSLKTLAVAEMATAKRSHQQLSERTLALLDQLEQPVTVALPAGIRSPVGRELRAGLRSVFDSRSAETQLALGVDRPARIARHDWRRSPIDLIAFAKANVPRPACTPPLLGAPLLYASALAAGGVLAEMLVEEEHR